MDQWMKSMPSHVDFVSSQSIRTALQEMQSCCARIYYAYPHPIDPLWALSTLVLILIASCIFTFIRATCSKHPPTRDFYDWGLIGFRATLVRAASSGTKQKKPLDPTDGTSIDDLCLVQETSLAIQHNKPTQAGPPSLDRMQREKRPMLSPLRISAARLKAFHDDHAPLPPEMDYRYQLQSPHHDLRPYLKHSAVLNADYADKENDLQRYMRGALSSESSVTLLAESESSPRSDPQVENWLEGISIPSSIFSFRLLFLRRGPPRVGRRPPERFADSKYSIWKTRKGGND